MSEVVAGDVAAVAAVVVRFFVSPALDTHDRVAPVSAAPSLDMLVSATPRRVALVSDGKMAAAAAAVTAPAAKSSSIKMDGCIYL